MKKLLFLSVALFFAITLSVLAQKEPKVSEKAKTSFAKAFPAAADVKWQKENKDYEVEFKLNGVETSVVINAQGKILETESAIEKTALPKGVEEFITKNHQGWQITETAKIIDDKNVITFEAQISKGKSKKDLLFDSAGKPILKKENGKEKD